MEEKGTMHVHLLTELTGNLYSEESEWEEEWSESDEYGMPLDGTELADYEEVRETKYDRGSRYRCSISGTDSWKTDRRSGRKKNAYDVKRTDT